MTNVIEEMSAGISIVDNRFNIKRLCLSYSKTFIFRQVKRADGN